MERESVSLEVPPNGHNFEVVVYSMPEKAKGLMKVVPARIRANFAQPVTRGDCFMTQEDAQASVPYTVESYRREYGTQGQIIFGRAEEMSKNHR